LAARIDHKGETNRFRRLKLINCCSESQANQEVPRTRVPQRQHLGEDMTSVSDLLNHKGRAIVSVLPSETLENAARLLTEKRVGAAVVLDRRGKLAGILSERDIVRAIADRGNAALAMRVEELMTKEVRTCLPSEPVKDLMKMMTLRRHRHVPVVDGTGDLVGVVSIGDAVKARLDEQASEVALLRDLNLSHV
jgi:CBS domain-containing protein